jgi:glycine/D-amino acid oxidase-like deaminating enzyme
VKNGLPATYPPITDDAQCDVAVIGGGITGAMIARRLARDGHGIVVLDRRDIGTGSTSASTALLQYEIDLPLVSLAQRIGREPAERAYQLSHASIDDLERMVRDLGIDCDFQRRTSIYLASDRRAARILAAEARARQHIGLNVRYHNRRTLAKRFGLSGEAALSNTQAASCDPYRLAHALLGDVLRCGGSVFDRTHVEQIDCQDRQVRLVTDRGPIVTARWVVVAMGYESQGLLRERVVNLDNTYAIVSQPIVELGAWQPDWMLWECKRAYLYLRVTGDGRLMAGGEDDRFHSAVRRDARLAAKAAAIEQKVRALVPGLQWEVEFSWGGTFGKTRDSLAYVGLTPEYPRCLFALGFGGNGITFSSIATNLIAQMVTDHMPPEAALFRFGR